MFFVKLFGHPNVMCFIKVKGKEEGRSQTVGSCSKRNGQQSLGRLGAGLGLLLWWRSHGAEMVEGGGVEGGGAGGKGGSSRLGFWEQN